MPIPSANRTKELVMKTAQKHAIKLYNSETEAAENEGIIDGIDGSIYDSIEEAELYFPEGGVFAFKEDDGIRVAWRAHDEV
jgi:hypothetical protein